MYLAVPCLQPLTRLDSTSPFSHLSSLIYCLLFLWPLLVRAVGIRRHDPSPQYQEEEDEEDEEALITQLITQLVVQ